ncbi:TPA: 16S rRNA (cytidine(1402)-2'-O)-methyltransferase [Candidatus Falkowbacteria bacterium]|nr:16S rRNA (cytidine(1402)-2'-O)-methyltransferase [Candidatus Falkowbacteria bacterium]
MNKGNLYIVATPIGNLGDMTFRAVEILKSVEIIWCEDTRETAKLLAHFDIKKKTTGLHQHSDDSKIIKMIEQYLGEGQDVAYVSDAGTPGISDPGGKVAQLAIERGVNIIPIPGASAVTAILSVSGFPTDKFLFLGFMPHKGKGKYFDQINESKITTVFYESPHRIIKTLEQMLAVVESEREVVVGRELTKMFETIYRGKLSEVIETVKEKVKGEFVVVVRGNQ